MKHGLIASLLLLLVGCGSSLPTDRHQSSRDNILDITERFIPIDMGEGVYLSMGVVRTLGEYVVVQDFVDRRGADLIYILDRESLTPLWSGVQRGNARNEVGNPGLIQIDEVGRRIVMHDYRKNSWLGFQVDSLLTTPGYAPRITGKMTPPPWITEYKYLNDTLIISSLMASVDWDATTKESEVGYTPGEYYCPVVQLNPQTGEYGHIYDLYYEGGESNKDRRFYATASIEHDLLVAGHQRRDFLALRTLSDEMICNIYGPNWSGGNGGFCSFEIVGDRIITLYAPSTEYEDMMSNNQLEIFDLQGEYIKTLQYEGAVMGLKYDEQMGRLYLFTSGENPMVYVETEGLLE